MSLHCCPQSCCTPWHRWDMETRSVSAWVVGSPRQACCPRSCPPQGVWEVWRPQLPPAYPCCQVLSVRPYDHKVALGQPWVWVKEPEQGAGRARFASSLRSFPGQATLVFSSFSLQVPEPGCARWGGLPPPLRNRFGRLTPPPFFLTSSEGGWE